MSFINSYSSIVSFVNQKIADIDNLSKTDAALVAAMAQLLNGRNNPISNMPALLNWLQAQENDVQSSSLVKEVTLLLGAAMGSKNTVWRMREILTSGTFTAPDNIAGDTVLVTASGGGASGSAVVVQPAATVFASSGNSGCFVEDYPYQVFAGQVINVVIGQGGAAVSASAAVGVDAATAPNSGGNTAFGLLIVPGGDAAVMAGGGWRSGYQAGATPETPAENSIRYKCGAAARSGTASALGAAAGGFGNGVNGTVATGANANGISPAANSGAAGGSVVVINNTASSTLTATSAPGSNGRVIVRWQEFV